MGRDDRCEDAEIWEPTLWGDPLNWLIEQVWTKPARWRDHLRWRHNPQPETGDQPLVDKEGRTYWLRVKEGDPVTALHVLYCGERVGYANLFWLQEGVCVELGDICLNREHRARGLGSLLIARVEEIARQLGAREIRGRVVRRDLEAFPGLLDWYRRQGFTTRPPGADNLANTVARIEKMIEYGR